MEEMCTACEDGEGFHLMGLFCVRERRRRWRSWRRTWNFGFWEEEESEQQTWEEMLFGGGGGVLGFNWTEATAQQIWGEVFFAGDGLILSLNGATFEQIWNGI